MKTIAMPGTDITASAVVLGLMRIVDKSDDEVRALMQAAVDSGIDFIDHADLYGPPYHGCERRWSEAMRLSPSERDAVTIQTKCGIRQPGPYFDFSYEHIVAAAERSLEALDTDRLDILLLHRPDALMEPEEVARAFDHLHASGKVLHFGVSNHTPSQIELLKRSVTRPLVANQIQLSVTHAPTIAAPLAMNMGDLDQSIDRDNGIIDYCRLNDITIQAWSPFQARFFDGPFIGNPKYGELNAVIDRLAERYGVKPEAIAVAWLTRHPAQMQVVLGTTTPSRVTAAAAGADIVLTREEWYELFRVAGHIVP